MTPAQKALITDLAKEVKPYVERIEAKVMTTQNHYGDYMALLSQFKDKMTLLAMAMACKEAGANIDGVNSAVQILVG